VRKGLVVLAWLVGGCTTTEMFDFSDRGEATTISIPCGESYKVYNQEPERRLIVRSRLAQEVMRKPCADFDRHNDAERFAKIAGLYVAQTLEKCTVVPGSSQVLAWDKFRFSYRCEGDPEPAGAKPQKRGLGRRA
jgi:hypothetical protein